VPTRRGVAAFLAPLVLLVACAPAGRHDASPAPSRRAAVPAPSESAVAAPPEPTPTPSSEVEVEVEPARTTPTLAPTTFFAFSANGKPPTPAPRPTTTAPAPAPVPAPPPVDDATTAAAARVRRNVAASTTTSTTSTTRAPGPSILPLHELVDGRDRTWTVVAPPGRRRGLLLALHGVGGVGNDMRGLGFEALALPAGVAVAYPNGLLGWNDQRPGADPLVAGAPVDDIAFLRRVIARTTAELGIDGARVVVTGLSNGGVMATKVACELSDVVRAVAVVAASAPQGFAERCRPTRAVAVALVNGAGDTRVPAAGGAVADWQGHRRGFVAPVDEVFGFWYRANGCTGSDVVASGAAATGRRATGCGGSPVQQLVVQGLGHEWPRQGPFDATVSVWDFLAPAFAG
jgi:polyhydroxybutyrate depolymerase